MPTNKELLESLRNEFQQLKYGEDDELNKLEHRGRMIISRVSGVNSEHYQQFVHTQFGFYVSGASERDEREAWESGQQQVINILSTMLEELELDESEDKVGSEDRSVTRSTEVFVVHGHDNEMKQAVARTIDKIGLEAVILHEKPNRGQTLIEKIERFSDVGFAIVLLSPDDTGYATAAGPKTARQRARQNVILELGYFAGKLGRENVVALYRGNIELPSDYDGVLYTPYDGDSGTWRNDLVKELRGSGYEVSADDL